VNINVGSLRGTRVLDATGSCPASAKYVRKLERISFTLVIGCLRRTENGEPHVRHKDHVAPCIARFAPLSSTARADRHAGFAEEASHQKKRAPVAPRPSCSNLRCLYSSASPPLSSTAPVMRASPNSPALSRTPCSMVPAMAGLSLRNCLELSRPCPSRWLS
jgi:hypothetical protein